MPYIKSLSKLDTISLHITRNGVFWRRIWFVGLTITNIKPFICGTQTISALFRFQWNEIEHNDKPSVYKVNVWATESFQI